MRIVAVQTNPIVGDIEGNAQTIIAQALHARDKLQSDLVVFPEMALTGYPPEDLLLRPELYLRTQAALQKIQQEVSNLYLILGLPTQIKQHRYNSAIVLYGNKILATYHKQQLPNYGVFDEKRYFTPGTTNCIVSIKNTKIMLCICEDLWYPNFTNISADLLISINASPCELTKPQARITMLRQRARDFKIPIIYVNCVGGQDELVFDGGSMVLNNQGQLLQQAAFFTKTLMPIDFTPCKVPKLNQVAYAYQALVLGVRDYVTKNHFPGVIVSVSGGIDSALTLAIAVDALGKDRVTTLFMPSRYTKKLSYTIVQQQTTLLGTNLTTIHIDNLYQAFKTTLKKPFAGSPKDITAENLQARCRATLLMAFANKKKLLVLATGNKSEMAVGYATLYGDMAGGLCVLKDVYKTFVYRLANYRHALIPPAAITRPPSAELKAHQQDTDTLPPYEILDAILKRYIELNQSAQTIIHAGFAEATVQQVIRMVQQSEYKRRQAPPGIRITTQAFGKERRYPITSHF